MCTRNTGAVQERLIHGGQKGNFFSVAPSQVEPTFTGNPQPSFLARPSQGPAKTRSFGKGLLWRLGLSSDTAQPPQEDSQVSFSIYLPTTASGMVRLLVFQM